jgi:dihydrofolate reductase
MISLIVAHASNNVIGKNNALPWYIPEDLKHFKNITTGHTVIMGRNTYESIIKRLGKPLPNRKNIVVSSTLDAEQPEMTVVGSLEKALEISSSAPEVFIIGGEKLYKAALESGRVQRMYITLIHQAVEGDVFFPTYELAEWQVVSQKSEKNDKFAYDFITYQKKEV